MNNALSFIAGIVAGAFSLATVAVLVSNKSNTGGVIKSAGSAVSGIIQAAVSPVSSSTGGLNAQ